MRSCLYFQADVVRADTWFFVAVLRSFEHLAFDRTLDKRRGRFEFFVPAGLEQYFLELMDYMQEQGIISDLQKLPNRLIEKIESP